MDPAAILRQALAGPPENLETNLAALMEEAAPGRAYLVAPCWANLLERFAKAGECRLIPIAGAPFVLRAHYVRNTSTTEGGLYGGCFRVEWQSITLTVFLFTVPVGLNPQNICLLTGNSQADTYRFHSAVEKWWQEQDKGISVFNGEDFSGNLELRESIRQSKLEDVVLAGDMKRRIAEDVSAFFDSESTYRDYRIPWKRGLIFIGPPGNGKTHMVKALINHVDKPSLYIRSLTPVYGSALEAIESVFFTARQSAPCIMVLEDLDSLVDDNNRSAFLNELDGFYENSGILILATANHPEKLDPAILDRPSRFDRKYHFAMPGTEERVKYMDLLSLRLDEKARPTDEMIYQIALETDGFSFAYLKELFLSSLMHWVHAEPKPTIPQSIMKMIPILREQIRVAEVAREEAEDDGKSDD